MNEVRCIMQWDLVFLVGYVLPDTVAVRREREIRRNQVAAEGSPATAELARRKVLLEATTQMLLKHEARTSGVDL
jgi:hypothetical protein